MLPAARTMINSMATLTTARSALVSTPGLAAALRRTHRRLDLPEPRPMGVQPSRDPLVQMYRIPADVDPASEAQAAAYVLLAVAERLRRLAAAYGEWEVFDVEAYFDLSTSQAEWLVHIVERVSTVHVTFHADLLLPAFQTAATFWQTDFRPAYLAMRQAFRHSVAPYAPIAAYTDHSLPYMIAHWDRLCQVTQATRAVLSNEVSYWAANGSDEARGRWRWAWQNDPAPGLPDALLPPLTQTPTLTLAVDFPLPAYRQPGRVRRLRRLQARRDQGRLRARSD